MNRFKVVSKFKPAGDQPRAIKKLVEGLIRLHEKLRRTAPATYY